MKKILKIFLILTLPIWFTPFMIVLLIGALYEEASEMIDDIFKLNATVIKEKKK